MTEKEPADARLRGIKWISTKWQSPGELRTRRFRALLSKDLGKQVFDDKFFDAIAERKKEQDKVLRRLWVIQFLILGFLALALFQIEATFSFFGLLVSKADGLREGLILATASIAVYKMSLAIDTALIEELLDARLDQQSRGDKTIREVLSLKYGKLWGHTPSFARSDERLVFEKPSSYLPVAVGVFGLIAVTLIFLAIYLAVHIVVLIDILHRPTFSKWFSWVVVAYDVCALIFIIGMSFLLNGRLPYWDMRNAMALARLRVKDPKKYQQLVEAALLEHSKKSWLAKLVRRPKAPKAPKA
jgi:hypothetical protein